MPTAVSEGGDLDFAAGTWSGEDLPTVTSFDRDVRDGEEVQRIGD